VPVVEHAPVLFRGTVLDNLRYAAPDASEAAVLEAARISGVDAMVAGLPDGYDTLVGEGGAGLSTGQIQRIAVARAVLADPLVVVLDEATSGLDVQGAQSLHDAIDAAFSQRTRIVITHHLAQTRKSDIVAQLHGARLSVSRT
jgi:ATP-binding cassette subfamily B protein